MGRIGGLNKEMSGITHETELIRGRKEATQNESKSPIQPFSIAAPSSEFGFFFYLILYAGRFFSSDVECYCL